MTSYPSKPGHSRRWWSFSLRALLALLLLLSLPLAWIANWRSGKIREHAVEQRLLELGGDTALHHNDPLAQNYEGSWLDFTLPENCRRPVFVYRSARRDFTSEKIFESPINDEVLGLLLQLPNLRRLMLSRNKPGGDLARLQALPQLDALAIGDVATDADVVPFLTQRHLKELYLGGQQITDQSLLIVARNPGLVDLNLDDTAISDSGLRHLASLRGLRGLDLSGTQVTSAGIAHLTTLQSLVVLHLQRTQVDDSVIPHLVKMRALRGVSVGETRVSPAGLKRIRVALSD